LSLQETTGDEAANKFSWIGLQRSGAIAGGRLNSCWDFSGVLPPRKKEMRHETKTNALFLQQISWRFIYRTMRHTYRIFSRQWEGGGKKTEEEKKERVNIKFFIISTDNTDYP
jgi:hypothetical protein